MLQDIVDNSRTDKNTRHSYLPLYQNLLEGKKDTAKNVLEIGVWNGESIRLWHDYFKNATIYGLDILPIENMWPEILNKERIKIYTSVNAYDEAVFNTFLNVKFDFMLDDGPHTLDSMKQFIRLYSQLMTEDGILIIEDVQDWSWIQLLIDVVPDHLKKYVKTYDLRSVKKRYDDIVFTIDKSKLK